MRHTGHEYRVEVQNAEVSQISKMTERCDATFISNRSKWISPRYLGALE